MTTTFARLFDSYLEQRGSVVRLAETTGLSQPYVSMIRSGERLPPLDKIGEIADALLLTGDERRIFLEEADLVHTPPAVQRKIQLLEARVRELSEMVERYRRMQP